MHANLAEIGKYTTKAISGITTRFNYLFGVLDFCETNLLLNKMRSGDFM